MALTGNITVTRRGPSLGRNFGYPVAPGEVVYAGSLVGLNASGQLVRIQTAGIVAFAGMALSGVNNVGQSTPSAVAVQVSNDVHGLTVPAATFANLNAKVYATDDGTLTLSVPGSGYTGQVGFLEGIDNGQTYVIVRGH